MLVLITLQVLTTVQVLKHCRYKQCCWYKEHYRKHTACKQTIFIMAMRMFVSNILRSYSNPCYLLDVIVILIYVKKINNVKPSTYYLGFITQSFISFVILHKFTNLLYSIAHRTHTNEFMISIAIYSLLPIGYSMCAPHIQ